MAESRMPRGGPRPTSNLDLGALPDILTVAAMGRIFGGNGAAISRWHRWGKLPRPVLSSGNIRRWRKEDVIAYIERNFEKVQGQWILKHGYYLPLCMGS
jgi:hypothetical protein